MCGILGTVSLTGPLSVDHHAFKKALDLQLHRGPDNGSIMIGSEFAFGHRRLSIIDLSSAANQPMVSEDGSFILVFNGEIYNFKEIRSRLESKGHKFRTNSDTEVLLNSFIDAGVRCVDDFIGMFAFAIYNKHSKETFIFRDRLGIKPLYFAIEKNCLSFSSEIKSLLSYRKLNRNLNVEAVTSYLSYRYPILDDSFFTGVESLSPGYYLRVSSGSVSKHKYWDPSNLFGEQQLDMGEEFYKEKIQELLQSSIEYRLIADVPSGAYLSGGIDSSIITALMANCSQSPVKTFTIGFDEKEYNEFAFARLVASEFETEHTEIHLSGEEYVETMGRLIELKDSPLSVPNEVPLYLLSKELKKQITVVLSGEGADEIFGGYGRIFRGPYDYARYIKGEIGQSSPDEWNIFKNNYENRYGAEPLASDVEHFLETYRYTKVSEKKMFLSKDLDLDLHEERLTQKFRNIFSAVPGESYFNRMSWAFIKVHVVGLLNRIDMTTMANSVEARVPFLDHRLVEFALTIPEKYKVKWKSEAAKHKARTLTAETISEALDIPKYILKRSYEHIIRKEVLYRPKMGFPVPLDKWFGGNLRDFASDMLLSESARHRGIYNIDEIKKVLFSDQIKNQHDLALKIWMLINLEMFCQKFFD